VEEPKAQGKAGDNRDALNDAFLSQSNVRAKNVVNELGQQFETPNQPPVSQPAAPAQQAAQFDSTWLEGKKVSQPPGGKPQSRVDTMNRPENLTRQNPQAQAPLLDTANDLTPGKKGTSSESGKMGGQQGEKKSEEADVVGRYQQRLNERSRQIEEGRNVDQPKGDKGAMGGMGEEDLDVMLPMRFRAHLPFPSTTLDRSPSAALLPGQDRVRATLRRLPSRS